MCIYIYIDRERERKRGTHLLSGVERVLERVAQPAEAFNLFLLSLLSIYLSIYLCFYPCIWLCIYLCVYLSISTSIYIFIYIYIYMYILIGVEVVPPLGRGASAAASRTARGGSQPLPPFSAPLRAPAYGNQLFVSEINFRFRESAFVN